jgi:hypothetical protein
MHRCTAAGADAYTYLCQLDATCDSGKESVSVYVHLKGTSSDELEGLACTCRRESGHSRDALQHPSFVINSPTINENHNE